MNWKTSANLVHTSPRTRTGPVRLVSSLDLQCPCLAKCNAPFEYTEVPAMNNNTARTNPYSPALRRSIEPDWCRFRWSASRRWNLEMDFDDSATTSACLNWFGDSCPIYQKLIRAKTGRMRGRRVRRDESKTNGLNQDSMSMKVDRRGRSVVEAKRQSSRERDLFRFFTVWINRGTNVDCFSSITGTWFDDSLAKLADLRRNTS